ncbi:MAG: MotA/TolQ/ExbB proton channel family protein [Candidatus Sericytochromatia bacterium]
MSQRSFSFSIFFSLLGIGGGLALVLASVFTSAEQLRLLYQPRGLAIIGGGLIAVVALSFRASDLKRSLALLWEIITGSAEPDCESLLKECVMLATRGRESEGSEQKFWREIRPYLSHEMLQAGVELLIAGYSPEMIRHTLQTRRHQHNTVAESTKQLVQTLTHSAWMLGLAGAVTGLLRTQWLSDRDTLPLYLGAIATPAIAGLLLSVLVFAPLLRLLQRHQRSWQNYLEMAQTGVLLLQERHHGLYLETVLKAFLPPQELAAPMPASPPIPGAVAVASKPSAFRQALAEQDAAPPAETGTDKALSVDELRRFRPVQRPPDKPST